MIPEEADKMTAIAIRRLSAVGATFLVCGLLVPAASAQTLEEIVASSLEASGGRAAFEAIRSVRQVGGFTMQTEFGPLDGDIETVIIPGQKFYEEQQSDLFEQRSGWNGTLAWQLGPQGLVDLEGPQAAVLLARSLLHPFLGFERPELGGAQFRKADDADLEGRSHHVVIVDVQDVEFSIFVDADTMLLSRFEFNTTVPQLGTVRITGDYSDYEDHGGVKLPTRQLLDVPGAFTVDTRYTTTEINVEVDQSIFEKP